MLNFLRNLKSKILSLSLGQSIALFFYLLLLISLPILIAAVVSQKFSIGKKAAGTLVANPQILEQNYLQSQEPGKVFQKAEVANKAVYYYQRTIDNAIVEKDFVTYQFDKGTGNFINKTSHFREGLPEHLPTLTVTKTKAESLVKGSVQFSGLYLISPESDIFKIKPLPLNPCWVVSSLENNYNKLTVIDAVTGKILGLGVPPPFGNGYSLSGPIYTSYSSQTCTDTWVDWYHNAQTWFTTLGFPTVADEWPSTTVLSSYLKNSSTKVFYELAHGDSRGFLNGCYYNSGDDTWTYPTNVTSWLASRDKLGFVFIGSCGGMCETSAGTFSYEFRKGSNEKSVTVGYCGMGDSKCADCWGYSISWQNNLFENISRGDTVKTAFDKALVNYPMCGEPNNCMRFAGDESYRITDSLTPTPTLLSGCILDGKACGVYRDQRLCCDGACDLKLRVCKAIIPTPAIGCNGTTTSYCYSDNLAYNTNQACRNGELDLGRKICPAGFHCCDPAVPTPTPQYSCKQICGGNSYFCGPRNMVATSSAGLKCTVVSVHENDTNNCSGSNINCKCSVCVSAPTPTPKLGPRATPTSKLIPTPTLKIITPTLRPTATPTYKPLPTPTK